MNTKHILAAFIDYIIILVILIISMLGMGGTPSFKQTAVFFGVTVSSFVFKDLFFAKASLGKRIFRLRIFSVSTGVPATVWQVILRNVTLVALLPVEMTMLFIQNRRVGDMIAGTEVKSI